MVWFVMKNKRGDMSWYLLAFVLVVIVLVVLAVGFGFSWSGLWNKMVAFGGNDVQTAVDGCQIECSKQSEYGFCNKIWKIKEVDKTREVTCKTLYLEQGLGDCDNICAGVNVSSENVSLTTP